MSRGTPRRMKMLPYSPRIHSYLLTRDFQRSIGRVFETMPAHVADFPQRLLGGAGVPVVLALRQ
jgi:hypothetical protein